MTRRAFRAFAVGPLGERFLTVKQPFVYGGAKMRKRIVVTVSVLAVLLVLAGCASMHSMFGADTSKLKIGVTSEQVIDAIGHRRSITRPMPMGLRSYGSISQCRASFRVKQFTSCSSMAKSPAGTIELEARSDREGDSPIGGLLASLMTAALSREGTGSSRVCCRLATHV
jgi:hypothetical protein